MSTGDTPQDEATKSSVDKEEVTEEVDSEVLASRVTELARCIAELENRSEGPSNKNLEQRTDDYYYSEMAYNGNGKISFERLKGRENFDEWRIAARSYLIIKKIWNVIEKPIPPDESPETNALAISEITLMIEPSLYSYIKETKSAKEVWDGINKSFADSGTVRKVTIMSQLVSIKLEKIGNMEKYINEILLYWAKSKIAGFKIEEDVIASLLLGGLPDQYRAMILGIENSGKELTVDYIKTVLLQGIKDPILTKSENDEEKAMPAKFGFKMKKGVKNTKGKRACFTCGSTYHLKFDCPKNKKKKCFNCGQTTHLAKQCKLPKKQAIEREEKKEDDDKEKVLMAL